jgi:hypothetical protein
MDLGMKKAMASSHGTMEDQLGPVAHFAEPVDVDLAIIPAVVVQDENTPADQALRPLFDLAWNAGGWSRSPFYNDVGQRQEPR